MRRLRYTRIDSFNVSGSTAPGHPLLFSCNGSRERPDETDQTTE